MYMYTFMHMRAYIHSIYTHKKNKNTHTHM
jgi:hypothetical protein